MTFSSTEMSDIRHVPGEEGCLPSVHSANLLVIGPENLASDYLMPLMSSLASPVVGIDGTDLPSAPVGTLIVRDVARLSLREQGRFLEWLTSHPARVITLSTDPLFTRVQQGAFSDELYYRLNTITVVLAPAVAS
jgi:hypothetical protein